MQQLTWLDASRADAVLALELANRDHFAMSISDRGDEFFERFTEGPTHDGPRGRDRQCVRSAIMDEKTEGHLRVIRRVVAVLRAADISAWLFGGWGLDARVGRITREHGDVEFWVERVHAERSKVLLGEAGATALPTQPPEEACEYVWDDVSFSTAYFDRRSDGTFSQPLGKFSDWLFPQGSFGEEVVMLDGSPVLAMSVSGMLAMKEQFPSLRNGRPWRQKDITDMEILRRLAT
jgi:hypothetical protein